MASISIEMPNADAASSVLMTIVISTYHWWYDTRTKGWFRDTFFNNDLDPIAATIYDGDAEGDRVVLLGGEDGYVRGIDSSASDDDGATLKSEITFNPILGENLADIVLSTMQLVSDRNGGTVSYEIAVGDSPELAFNTLDSTFSGDGTFAVGGSYVANIRLRGHAIYVRMGSATGSQWAFESLKTTIAHVANTRTTRSRNSS